MEQLVEQLIGMFIRICIRHWVKESEYGENLNGDIIELIEFAENMGLSHFEAKKFKRTIEDFTDQVSNDYIKRFGAQIADEERKNVILQQIQEDIRKINLKEADKILLFNKPYELQKLIMKKSEQERTYWEETEVEIYANCIKYVIEMGTEFVLKLPDFSPIALKSLIQHQEEYGKDLQEILKGIHIIEKSFKNSAVVFREYESIYRERVVEKYGKIELIGSKINDSKCTRFDITMTYVELNCTEGKTKKELELSRVFENENCILIKGEAGAGKTTFLQWVAICSAKGDNESIKNINNTIPIVVELRNAELPLNLNNVIDNVTSSEGIHCPEGWLYELLNEKNVILLLDGLDEISKRKKKEIYNFIEDFIENYPKAKILLTARNSVKENINCIKACYEIVPMRMEHIKSFIKYWHKSILRRDAAIDYEQINRLQSNLMQRIIQNQSLNELARNPLLCAMLCALNYTNKELIPVNKMQLYEECCKMLMDTRDIHRKIDTTIYNNVPELDYITKRRILEEIAFRMMKNGVSSESKQTILRFLDNLLKDTNVIVDSNSYSVESTLDFLIERCGIIREPEEGVIDFIHKTFMEFLAVDTILRNSDRDILIKEACNINWRETIIMCFSKMGENDIIYVLEQLVSRGKERHDDRYFLIASLCVSNAHFFKGQSPIKIEINEKIKEMIPPSDQKIDEMAELGSYLLAFLKNSDKYTIVEKYNCLILLAKCREKEAIPIILTYIIRYYDEAEIGIYEFALELLLHYSEEELEEYNVKSFLMESMLEYINGDRLLTYQSAFYILNEFQPPKETIEQLEKVKVVYIQTRDCDRGYYKKAVADFGKYFIKCIEIQIGGDTKNYSFLQFFYGVKKIALGLDIYLEVLTFELSKLKNLESVTYLMIKTRNSELYNIIRLSENLKNLETITIILDNQDMKIDSNTFYNFVKLKELIFVVDKKLIKGIEENIDVIRGNNNNLSIIAISNDEDQGDL